MPSRMATRAQSRARWVHLAQSCPTECWEQILCHLPCRQIAAAATVCKEFARIQPAVLQRACQLRFPEWSQAAQAPQDTNWKRLYDLLEQRERDYAAVGSQAGIARTQKVVNERHRAVLAEWLIEVGFARRLGCPPYLFPHLTWRLTLGALSGCGGLDSGVHHRLQGHCVSRPLPQQHQCGGPAKVRTLLGQLPACLLTLATVSHQPRRMTALRHTAPPVPAGGHRLHTLHATPRLSSALQNACPEAATLRCRFQLVGIACIRCAMYDAQLKQPLPGSKSTLDPERFAFISDGTFSPEQVEQKTAELQGRIMPELRAAPTAKLFLRTFWYRLLQGELASSEEMHLYTVARCSFGHQLTAPAAALPTCSVIMPGLLVSTGYAARMVSQRGCLVRQHLRLAVPEWCCAA